MKQHSGEKDIAGRNGGPRRFRIVVPLLLCLLGGQAGRVLADDAGPGKTGPGGAPDRVAATVNGVDISGKSVTVMMNRMHAGVGRGHSAPDANEVLRKKALNMVILQELAWQKAGGKVDREAVERKIASMKERVGGDEEYRNILRKEGMTEGEAEALVGKGIVFDRMFEVEVLGKAAVSEDDIRKEYEKEKERYHTPEKVEVVDVVFFLETGKKESTEKAAEILRRIKAEEGGDPYRLEPDGTFIVREIEVRKEKDPVLYEEAKKLAPGELSGVIETPDSLRIIRLRSVTPERQYSYDQVKASLEGQLKQEAAQKRMREWEEELKRGATIEIVEAGGSRK